MTVIGPAFTGFLEPPDVAAVTVSAPLSPMQHPAVPGEPGKLPVSDVTVTTTDRVVALNDPTMGVPVTAAEAWSAPADWPFGESSGSVAKICALSSVSSVRSVVEAEG